MRRSSKRRWGGLLRAACARRDAHPSADHQRHAGAAGGIARLRRRVERRRASCAPAMDARVVRSDAAGLDRGRTSVRPVQGRRTTCHVPHAARMGEPRAPGADVDRGVWVVALATRVDDPARGQLGFFAVSAIAFLAAGRATTRALARRRDGYAQSAVIVGAGEVGQLVATKAAAPPRVRHRAGRVRGHGTQAASAGRRPASRFSAWSTTWRRSCARSASTE